ncbi:hypothetical protein GWK47_019961 [Chionoecetes opilio]|uniref:Regulatory protein zeste n=1 Tax=Chionoecetes opilio TaxID=41210 RepID=A0A8J5CIL9_CHIOP|nr:hypothetical protein GWK47_019961 [Chionoecetes opilio]
MYQRVTSLCYPTTALPARTCECSFGEDDRKSPSSGALQAHTRELMTRLEAVLTKSGTPYPTSAVSRQRFGAIRARYFNSRPQPHHNPIRGETNSAVARKFEINESAVQYLKKQEAQIRHAVTNQPTTNLATNGRGPTITALKRGTNFSKDETELLLKLVKERQHIINGRCGPQLTRRDKQIAWKDITACLNAAFPVVNRTREQAQSRWLNLLIKESNDLLASQKAVPTAASQPSHPHAIVSVDESSHVVPPYALMFRGSHDFEAFGVICVENIASISTASNGVAKCKRNVFTIKDKFVNDYTTNMIADILGEDIFFTAEIRNNGSITNGIPYPVMNGSRSLDAGIILGVDGAPVRCDETPVTLIVGTDNAEAITERLEDSPTPWPPTITEEGEVVNEPCLTSPSNPPVTPLVRGGHHQQQVNRILHEMTQAYWAQRAALQAKKNYELHKGKADNNNMCLPTYLEPCFSVKIRQNVRRSHRRDGLLELGYGAFPLQILLDHVQEVLNWVEDRAVTWPNLYEGYHAVIKPLSDRFGSVSRSTVLLKHTGTCFPEVTPVVRDIVGLAHQVGMPEVEAKDVDELLESHSEELSVEDLREIEQQRAVEGAVINLKNNIGDTTLAQLTQAVARVSEVGHGGGVSPWRWGEGGMRCATVQKKPVQFVLQDSLDTEKLLQCSLVFSK